MRRGWREPIGIGMIELGLHVQLSGRQGEKVVSQLEEKGSKLHRKYIPHGTRQTGDKTETACTDIKKASQEGKIQNKIYLSNNVLLHEIYCSKLLI